MIQVLDTGRLDVYNDPRKDFEDWGVSNAGGTEMSMPIQRGCDVLYYDSRDIPVPAQWQCTTRY